jgi:hypothetical protein
MEIEEWDAALQQLAREREALDGAYQDLQERLARDAAEAEETGVKRLPEERVAGLIQLSSQLGNFENFEREHAESCAPFSWTRSGDSGRQRPSIFRPVGPLAEFVYPLLPAAYPGLHL